MTEIHKFLLTNTLETILEKYPIAANYLANLRFYNLSPELTLSELLSGMDDTASEELGVRREDIPYNLAAFLQSFTRENETERVISELTIIGGKNKLGEREDVTVTLRRGDVAAVVGPTGSGKSCLLADIECLAQCDTPTGRQILINGLPVPEQQRFDMDGKLVAQLSQNMNFVMDLTVHEFLVMHAGSRFTQDVEQTVKLCFERANELAGEKFALNTKVTQLSGGQSRALMIADTAYMSLSPLVLIDEIENAGIDRIKAISVLAKNDKIVLIATHDPLLALSAGKRIVIKNGGILKVIETPPEEKVILSEIEKLDNTLSSLRSRLRSGQIIDKIEGEL